MTKVIKMPVSGKPRVPSAGDVFHNIRFGEGYILKVYILMKGDQEAGYQLVVRYRADPPRVYRKYTYRKSNQLQVA